MASTVTRSQSNRATLGCGGMGDSHHGCAANKSAATAWCYHVDMDQNPKEECLQHLVEYMPRRRQFWRQRGVQPGTSKVCLIQWPVSVCHIIYMGIYQYAVFLLTYLQFINFQICNLSNNISQIPSFFDSICKLTCGDFTYFGPYGAKAPKIVYILLDWWLRVQIYGALL